MSEVAERIRAAYAAYNRGEVDAVLELLDPDVEWRPPPNSVEPQPLHGREAVRRYLALDVYESQTAEPLEVIEEGNRVLVVARARARARASGIELDQTSFHLLVVEGDRVVRFEAHVDRDVALAAFREP
jgi:ketosteroid isomerase-like protein